MPFQPCPPHATGGIAVRTLLHQSVSRPDLVFLHAPVRLEKDSADGKPPFYLTLMRRLLLFNALADNFDRGAAQVPGRSGAATTHRHIASAGCSGSSSCGSSDWKQLSDCSRDWGGNFWRVVCQQVKRDHPHRRTPTMPPRSQRTRR